MKKKSVPKPPSLFQINLARDGSFPCPSDKLFTLKQKTRLRLNLESRCLFSFIPYALTSLPKPSLKKPKAVHYPKPVEIKEVVKVTRQQIEHNYTLVEGNFNLEGTWQCDITPEFSGSLFIQIIFVKSEENIKTEFEISKFAKCEYFLVEPIMVRNGKTISYAQLNIQTVFPNLLGPIANWKDCLKSQVELMGYNGFHFAPVQKLGGSQSLYSVKNQLKLSDEIFGPGDNNEKMNKLKETIKFLDVKLNAQSFIDILLNHTSYDSKWILKSADSYYNVQNTPKLKSALALDRKLAEFSTRLSEKKVEKYKKGNVIESEADLETLIPIIEEEVFAPLKLHEYFLFCAPSIVSKLKETMQKLYPDIKIKMHESEVEDDVAAFNIFSKEKDDVLEEFLGLHIENLGVDVRGTSINFTAACENLVLNAKKHSYELYELVLKNMNVKFEIKAKEYLNEALTNIKNNITYEKIKSKNSTISSENPLVQNYFTPLRNGDFAANNGWILFADPKENFAGSHNFHYLRRNIVIWRDLIKLRYGESKKDSPFLWKHMKTYVQSCASIFHGFRIDNAHSTPLHVGEYFMRKARQANPNLHVFCELFCGDPSTDALYTKVFGANALIKEAQHMTEQEHVTGTFHFFGRFLENSVGSIEGFQEIDWRTGEKWKYLLPKAPYGILYDQTHDNPSYFDRNNFINCLPIISEMSFANCFLGSIRGFDEFYPKRISTFPQNGKLYQNFSHIEPKQIFSDVKIPIKILYTPTKKVVGHIELRGDWDNWANGLHFKLKDKKSNLYEVEFFVKPGKYEYKFLMDTKWEIDPEKEVNKNGNMILDFEETKRLEYENLQYPRSVLNKFQVKLNEKYPEAYLEKKAYDVVEILREHSSRTKFYVLVARNAFSLTQVPNVDVTILLPGKLKSCKFIFHMMDTFVKSTADNSKFFSGNKISIFEEKELRRYCDIFYDHNAKKHSLRFTYMPPGFVCIIKSAVCEEKKSALTELNNLLFDGHPTKWNPEKLVMNLKPTDINYLMFSSDPEEKELNSQGPYHIPKKGKVSFAGLGGLYQDLRHAAINNDLSFALFDNLRQGYWIMDYIINRLEKRPNLSEIHNYLSNVFELMKKIPKHDLPTYFAHIILELISIVELKTLTNIKQPKVKLHTRFLQKLVFSSYQFLANIPSSASYLDQTTLAAGLPHFSTGWARCWGRDTFISFRGLLLIPGLYEEAKDIILTFASCMRHGLIPNLLDKGSKPRYNCRDATWWFIKAIKDYIEVTKDESILKKEVNMRFLDDNEDIHKEKMDKKEEKKMLLQDIIQEILQRHAEGVKFREWTAGFELDWNMEYDGFNIYLSLDEETGFIVGGNGHNCLTWMDKMGSSLKSGSKGIPSTPRDGAPIEMTALLFVALEFLNKSFEAKIFPYEGVKLQEGRKLSYKSWSEKIKANFEKNYFVPTEKDKNAAFNILEGAVRRRGIYRDVIKCSKIRAEYQLRPNACIAIACAPELFSKKNAFLYLSWVEEMLIEEESIGIKTLDRIANEYVGKYDNSDDSENIKTAQGYSYHNGPEWVWLYGFFVKAFVAMGGESKNFRLEQYMSYFTNHKTYIRNNEWISLPELTNQNGDFCEFSCPSQAWSTAAVLEACYDSIRSVLDFKEI